MLNQLFIQEDTYQISTMHLFVRKHIWTLFLKTLLNFHQQEVQSKENINMKNRYSVKLHDQTHTKYHLD